MGNTSQYNSQKWHVERQFPYYQLLTNYQGEQVQRYFISSLEHCNLRLRINSPIEWVQLLSYNNKENIHYLIMERTTKLFQFKEIPFFDAILILKQSLKAYLSLSNVFGRFDITQGMIGLNNKNQVKMWINQNFAANLPTKLSLDKDKALIDKIINIISTHVKERKQQFLNILPTIGEINFRNSIRYLQNLYNSIKSTKISVNKIVSKRSSPQRTTRQHKTAEFQCQVSLPPQVFYKPILINSPRLRSKRSFVQNSIQTDRVFDTKTNNISNHKPSRALSPQYSTNATLHTQREMCQKNINCSDSLMKRIRSQSSFMNKIDLFEGTDFNGSVGNTQNKVFPTNLPIVISLDEVPSKEVIVVEESTIILGGENYQLIQ